MKSTRPVAVITGAARGIGKGCALELARGGFNLLINDRPDADSVEKLHITQQECLQKAWKSFASLPMSAISPCMKRCSTRRKTSGGVWTACSITPGFQ